MSKGVRNRVGTGNRNHQSENSISDEYWGCCD